MSRRDSARFDTSVTNFSFCFQPKHISIEKLDVFCKQLGIFAHFIPEDVDVLPPRKSLPSFGLKDPTLREKQLDLEMMYALDGADFLPMDGSSIIVGNGAWG